MGAGSQPACATARLQAAAAPRLCVSTPTHARNCCLARLLPPPARRRATSLPTIITLESCSSELVGAWGTSGRGRHRWRDLSTGQGRRGAGALVRMRGRQATGAGLTSPFLPRPSCLTPPPPPLQVRLCLLRPRRLVRLHGMGRREYGSPLQLIDRVSGKRVTAAHSPHGLRGAVCCVLRPPAQPCHADALAPARACQPTHAWFLPTPACRVPAGVQLPGPPPHCLLAGADGGGALLRLPQLVSLGGKQPS